MFYIATIGVVLVAALGGFSLGWIAAQFTGLVIALDAQRKRHLKLEQTLVHTPVPARQLDMADRQCSLPVAYVVKRKKQKANPKAGQKGK